MQNITSLSLITTWKKATVLKKNADVFFDNPIGKTATKSKGVETFGDESTVVKYYSSGVLEYSNYKVETERENTFANNYISALSV